MPKSKSDEAKKWLRRIGWISGLLARFMPAKVKVLMVAVSTIAGGLVALLDRCDQQDKSPASPVPSASPVPMPAITPSPTPQPTPTKPPLPELKAPRSVKAGELFKVELCNVGNRYDVSLFAEEYRLAYIGFGKPCMFVHVKLNQKGKRELMAIGPDNLRVFADVVVE
jgi:hypothetical protein